MVTAVATRSPLILQAGILNGRYSWRVQTNLLVTYQNTKEYTQQSLRVTVVVARTSAYQGIRGLGIFQFVVEDVTKEKDSKPQSFEQ